VKSTLNNKTENAHGVKDTQTRNPPPKRLCFRACSHLPCSIQGYRISSLDVIERWSLCYHLGCVVTCLAKVGLEQSNKSPLENWKIEDLKKAEWYLARELSLPQKCHLTTIGEQPFTTEAVLEDWQLSSSFHLSEALYHIKASKSPSMREESLREALKHLSAEIAAEIQTLKGSINGTTRKQDHCFEVLKYPSPMSVVHSGSKIPSQEDQQACPREGGGEQTTNEERGENE
jgi:hypothetical protein